MCDRYRGRDRKTERLAVIESERREGRELETAHLRVGGRGKAEIERASGRGRKGREGRGEREREKKRGSTCVCLSLRGWEKD